MMKKAIAIYFPYLRCFMLYIDFLLNEYNFKIVMDVAYTFYMSKMFYGFLHLSQCN
jgi:hypothetical protein